MPFALKSEVRNAKFEIRNKFEQQTAAQNSVVTEH